MPESCCILKEQMLPFFFDQERLQRVRDAKSIHLVMKN